MDLFGSFFIDKPSEHIVRIQGPEDDLSRCLAVTLYKLSHAMRRWDQLCDAFLEVWGLEG